jgi:hypothetical protein
MRKPMFALLIALSLAQGSAATATEAWGRRGCHSTVRPRSLHVCFKPGPVQLVPVQ